LWYTTCPEEKNQSFQSKLIHKVARKEETPIFKGNTNPIPNPTRSRKVYLSHTHLFHTLFQI
jgi:hypothetical protein